MMDTRDYQLRADLYECLRLEEERMKTAFRACFDVGVTDSGLAR
jgi:hypothetical protein